MTRAATVTERFWTERGFGEVGTGGGCTAYERDMGHGRRIWLATFDASVPETLREAVVLYFERDVDDGEPCVSFNCRDSREAARIIAASSWWPR